MGHQPRTRGISTCSVSTKFCLGEARAIFYAVSSYSRLKNSESIIDEINRQVRTNPIVVSHVPQALQFLVTTETLLNDTPEVRSPS